MKHQIKNKLTNNLSELLFIVQWILKIRYPFSCNALGSLHKLTQNPRDCNKPNIETVVIDLLYDDVH